MILQAFGQIENPLTIINPSSNYGALQAPSGNGGLVGFISNGIKLFIVAAGLYVLFNLLTAGLDFVTSEGDPKGAESAKAKIMNSLIGIVVIAGAFIATAIIGQILFGKYDAILNPTIYGPDINNGS